MEVLTFIQTKKVTLMMDSTHKVISHKVGLLNLAEELQNVSQACKVMGFSRDTFYRYKEAVEAGGVDALLEKNRRKPNVRNRVEPAVEKAVVQHALDEPAHGQVRASNELRRRGISVSPTGVRGIWLRHELGCFKDRLKALEKHVAETGKVLTESQVQALERKQQEKEAHGEIETEHPGYLGSQDTFYVGTLKGVGRVYQQTYVDTYCKVAHAKLYTCKTPITAADLLNERVLPFYEEHGFEVLRVLTDRGTEYCGKPEHHDYQLYLALNDIEHTRNKARHPQTNGIVERFHKTILNEFYQVVFRKQVFETIEQLQKELDQWLEKYNTERTHQGKMCCGRTPLETLIDGKQIWQEKKLA